MVDFVKIVLRNPGSISKHPKLEFKRRVSEKTGELDSKCVADFLGGKFLVYDSGYSEFQGSLHKMHNGGIHNHNSFSFQSLKSTTLEFCDTFGFRSQDCELKNIEFGINIAPSIPSQDVINGVIFHRNQVFATQSVLNNGYYRQAVHNRYLIKCYDKAKQYNVPGDIFRFEVKYRKMIGLPVSSLKDLIDPTWIPIIRKDLVKKWNEVVFFDPTIQIERLSKYVRMTKIHQWSNPNFWSEIDKSKRYKELKKYSKVVDSSSKNIKHEISKRIDNHYR